MSINREEKNYPAGVITQDHLWTNDFKIIAHFKDINSFLLFNYNITVQKFDFWMYTDSQQADLTPISLKNCYLYNVRNLRVLQIVFQTHFFVLLPSSGAKW